MSLKMILSHGLSQVETIVYKEGSARAPRY